MAPASKGHSEPGLPVRTLWTARSCGLLEQVVIMNDYQKRRFAERIVKTMFHSVSDKWIGIWGFAFKKDTNDTRESAAIHVCRDLLRERAKLKIYDPRVSADQSVPS